MIELIGVGAGGHAKVIVDILRIMGNYKIVGLLDTNEDLGGTEIYGIPVLGNDDLLHSMYERGLRHAFIGVGTIANSRPRQELYEKVRKQGFQIVSAIHPLTIISSSAIIGHGPTIMAGAIVNAEAQLGDNVIVNTGAIIEHDCIIGNHAHIATGAKLASTVQVGNGAHVGVGSVIRQCINIGDGAVIGAGAVVVKDVPQDTVVVGVPARPLVKLRLYGTDNEERSH